MSAYYISKAEIPRITIAQLQQNPNVIRGYNALIIPKFLIYSNLIVNIAITIWSLTIWSFAVKHAREIEKSIYYSLDSYSSGFIRSGVF